MPSTQHICSCGNEYKLFQSYKNHLIKYKCNLKPTESEPDPDESAGESLTITPSTTPKKTNIQIDKSTIDYSAIPVLTDEERQRLDITPPSSKPVIHKKRKCIYCTKEFTKNNIKRHEEVYCKHRYKKLAQYKHLVRAGVQNIPCDTIEIMELYDKLLITQPDVLMNTNIAISHGIERQTNSNIDGINANSRQLATTDSNTKNQITSQLQNQLPIAGINNINVNNINQTNNIQNINNNIQNNNIVNQNINIIINPVCKEDLTHITPERQLFIILQRKHAIKAFYDTIYENMANHNIIIQDRQGEKVKYLDEQHGINNGETTDVIGDIAMAHIEHLDGFIETHKNDVPEHRKNDLQYLEDYLLDEHNNPKVIKQLIEKIECIHNTSKTLLEKYEKMKVETFLNSQLNMSSAPQSITN